MTFAPWREDDDDDQPERDDGPVGRTAADSVRGRLATSRKHVVFGRVMVEHLLAEHDALAVANKRLRDERAYPGKPGDVWRDDDGSRWIHGADGNLHLIAALTVPWDPAAVEQQYAPMTIDRRIGLRREGAAEGER